jgi:hypothetical protein
LMNDTASEISLNKGGVNQNHLHHLQHTSMNTVTLKTVITPATSSAMTPVQLTHLGIGPQSIPCND